MFLDITMYLLAVAVMITLIRIAKGPTVWDRLMALNLISVKVILLLTIYGVNNQDIMLLDISISYGIIGFLGIVLLCKFILKGGRHK